MLWSAPLRDLLVRVAIARLVQAKWTDDILDETFRTLQEKRPDIAPDALARTRDLMNRAVDDALVVGHEGLIGALQLPDVDDRHVLAAAIHAGAQVVVTFNTPDFPSDALSPHHVEAAHPDDFVLDLLDLAEGTVIRILQEQAAALRNPHARWKTSLRRWSSAASRGRWPGFERSLGADEAEVPDVWSPGHRDTPSTRLPARHPRGCRRDAPVPVP